MILGVGTDLCRVARIRKSIERFGRDWLQEVFTGAELARNDLLEGGSVSAAIGFATKEACSKALGTGFSRGVRPHDFDVLLAPAGLTVKLDGAAARRALRLSPTGLEHGFFVDVSSGPAWVVAHAVLFAGDPPAIAGSFSRWEIAV